MTRHFDMKDLSIGVPNHEENVKRLEQDSSNAEKVASPNVLCVALEELWPTQGWAAAAAHPHILSNGSGRNLER